MKNAIKNVFLMGLGAASLTKKKAEATVKVFVKKGVIDNKQAREIIDRVMTETNKVKDKLKKEGKKQLGKVKKKAVAKGNQIKKRASKVIKKTGRKIARAGMKL